MTYNYKTWLTNMSLQYTKQKTKDQAAPMIAPKIITC